MTDKKGILIYQKMRTGMRALVAREGLTESELEVLLALGMNDVPTVMPDGFYQGGGGVTGISISRLPLDMFKKSTISIATTRLAKGGYISKGFSPDEIDHRTVYVAPTEKGRAVYDEIATMINQALSAGEAR